MVQLMTVLYCVMFVFSLLHVTIYLSNTSLRYHLSFTLFGASIGAMMLGVALFWLPAGENGLTHAIALRLFGMGTLTVAPAALFFASTVLLLTPRLRKVLVFATNVLLLYSFVLFGCFFMTDNYLVIAGQGEAARLVAKPLFVVNVWSFAFAAGLALVALTYNFFRYRSSKDMPYTIRSILAGYLGCACAIAYAMSPAIRTVFPRPPIMGESALFFPFNALIGIALILLFVSYNHMFLTRMNSLFVELAENKKSIDVLLKRTKENTKDMIYTMVKTLEQRDKNTAGHSERVAQFTKNLARAMGYPEKAQELIYMGALMHDIGKINISEKVLRKKTKLTQNEYEMIKKHPAVGAEILSYIDDLLPIIDIVYYHHERVDGHGYPEGLAGDDIPEMARIVAVCDVFDALTSYRVYHERLSYAEASAVLERCAGTQIDKNITAIFIAELQKSYPSEFTTTRSAYV